MAKPTEIFGLGGKFIAYAQVGARALVAEGTGLSHKIHKDELLL